MAATVERTVSGLFRLVSVFDKYNTLTMELQYVHSCIEYSVALVFTAMHTCRGANSAI